MNLGQIGHVRGIDAKLRELESEPANAPHFAFTGDSPAVVYITGQGPSDTHYVSE